MVDSTARLEWKNVLDRVFANRGSHTYMPALLLAGLDMVDGGEVDFSSLRKRFDEILPGAAHVAWEPFFHLFRNGVWDLLRNGKPASIKAVPFRPKTEGALKKLADGARFRLQLGDLRNPACRNAVRLMTRSRLLEDDQPEGRALGVAYRMPKEHTWQSQSLSKDDPRVTVNESVRMWSDYWQTYPDECERELGPDRNFVADVHLVAWTFTKSVGRDGEYHDDGGAACVHLINGLEYIDARKLPKSSPLRMVAEESFRLWAGPLCSAKVLSGSEWRLLIPPDANASLWQSKPNASKRLKQDQFYDEGERLNVVWGVRERNSALVREARLTYDAVCAVCEFDFSKVYGPHGDGYIEFHHLRPLKEGARASRVEDLSPVCANCHRMLHRSKDTLSIEELRMKCSLSSSSFSKGKPVGNGTPNRTT